MATTQKPKVKEVKYVETDNVEVQEYIETVEKPKVKEVNIPKNNWEIKDRIYIIADSHSPLTYTLQGRHTSRYPLLWFDETTGEQEELRYATNQNSPFVSEQKGQATLGHIIFENGTLNVPKEKQNLQKLLSIYHPGLNNKYTEFDSIIEAEDDLDYLEFTHKIFGIINIGGRLDAISNDCVWEFKCVDCLTIEHKLQLVIYYWMWNHADYDNIYGKKNFYLLNIKTGQTLKLNYSTNEYIIEQIIEILFNEKYIIKNDINDIEFINLCNKNVYDKL